MISKDTTRKIGAGEETEQMGFFLVGMKVNCSPLLGNCMVVSKTECININVPAISPLST
jgi:hypothetical protein